MKKIRINHSDILYMVENVLREIGQNNIVDNFEWVENYIRKTNPNDEWGDNFY